MSSENAASCTAKPAAGADFVSGAGVADALVDAAPGAGAALAGALFASGAGAALAAGVAGIFESAAATDLFDAAGVVASAAGAAAGAALVPSAAGFAAGVSGAAPFAASAFGDADFAASGFGGSGFASVGALFGSGFGVGTTASPGLLRVSRLTNLPSSTGGICTETSSPSGCGSFSSSIGTMTAAARRQHDGADEAAPRPAFLFVDRAVAIGESVAHGLGSITSASGRPASRRPR